jgi:hypothetical protein
MTINIREDSFETNSSSTHSIVLNFNDNNVELDDTIVPNSDGEIIISGEDFTGLEFMIQGAESKAALIATYIMVYDDKDLKKKFESVLMKQTGAKKISYDIRFVAQNDIPANAFYCPDITDIYYYNDDDEEIYFQDLIKKKEFLKRFIFCSKINIEAGEIYC